MQLECVLNNLDAHTSSFIACETLDAACALGCTSCTLSSQSSSASTSLASPLSESVSKWPESWIAEEEPWWKEKGDMLSSEKISAQSQLFGRTNMICKQTLNSAAACCAFFCSYQSAQAALVVPSLVPCLYHPGSSEPGSWHMQCRYLQNFVNSSPTHAYRIDQPFRLFFRGGLTRVA
jgi:hypothetical protein